MAGRCARIHVPAVVQVVVDLGGAAEHMGVEEYRERRGLERPAGERSAAIRPRQDLQKQAEITASTLTQ